jgi:hypothetical protein
LISFPSKQDLLRSFQIAQQIAATPRNLNIPAGRDMSREPPEKLGKIPWSGISTNGFGYTAPNKFSRKAGKEKMKN